MATKKKTKVEEVKVKKSAKKTTKKKDSITLDMPGTIGGAKLVFPETKVVKGSHLTITYNNGYPEKLEWDDEALMRDVREALASAELATMKPNVKAKVITQRKKTEAKKDKTK
jgi:hypothetical protein